MSERKHAEYTLLSASPVRAITSSTDATPIKITTAANHGLATGDRVSIFGHTTNVATNGNWTITKVDADEFTLDGSVGSGAGAGAAGIWNLAPKIALVEDFNHCILSYDTDGGGDAAFVMKVVGSNSETSPDFSKPQSTTNKFEFLEVIDLEDGSAIDGDTGITVASADDHRMFEVNINAMRWLSILIISGTAGELTVTLKAFSD